MCGQVSQWRPKTLADEVCAARVSLKMVLCGQYTFYLVALKLKGSHEAIVYALLDVCKLSVANIFSFPNGWTHRTLSPDGASDLRDPGD